MNVPALKRKKVSDYVKEQFTSGIGVPTYDQLMDMFDMSGPTILKALKEANINLPRLRRQFEELKPLPASTRVVPTEYAVKSILATPQTQPSNTYKETSDVRAAYLYYNGCVPIGTERKEYDGHPKTAFIFEKSDRLARLVMDYKGSEANKLANCIISFRKLANERIIRDGHGSIPEDFFNSIIKS